MTAFVKISGGFFYAFVAASLGLGLATASVTAQVRYVNTGDRVRVGFKQGGAVIGSLVETGPLQVVVTGTDGSRQTLDRGQIQSVELSRGYARRTLLGAGVGWAGGAILGMVIAKAANGCEPSLFDSICEYGSVAGGALLGLLAGTITGAIVGSQIRKGQERWTTGLFLEPPKSGPLGLGLSFQVHF